MTESEIVDIVNDVAARTTKTAAAELAQRAGISKKEAYRRLLDKGE